MIHLFFNKILNEYPMEYNRMIGYHEDEMQKIERVFRMKIVGDFKHFMIRAGKSDGGLIGDESLILYRQEWDIRTHIVWQEYFLRKIIVLQEYKSGDKPFMFSIENDLKYYFLRTGIEQDGFVFCFNEEEGMVFNTNMTFVEYLFDLMSREKPNGVVCHGDLLQI